MAVITIPSDAEIREVYLPYVQAVGEVAHSWNYLIESLGELFAEVVNKDERRVVLATWFSVPSDRMQMSMLKGALTASAEDRWLPRLPRAREDLIWLVDRANSLADDRNNAVHAPCTLFVTGEGAEMGASFWSGNPRARKLEGKQLLAEFQYCRDYAERLTKFARYTWSALASEKVSWPDRPDTPQRG